MADDKTYTQAQLEEAVHAAIQQAQAGLYSNEAAIVTERSVRQIFASALSGGYDAADTLHNIYMDYGYPSQLTFYNYWNMYRRFGVARRVITAYPNTMWLDDPVVESNNPAFMRELRRLIGTDEQGTIARDGYGLWRRLKGLDVRQRVGRYGGLFMRVRDDKRPDEPIDGKLNGLASLVDIMPLYESQLKVVEEYDDPTSELFGQPKMYEYSSGATGNRNDRTSSTFRIHPSRVVIAAEGADNGSIYGIPALEAVYNDLMDLRKILGGGGEGFYKNAAQSIVFDLKDASSAAANKELLDEFNDKYDDFAQNRMRRSMWTPGMEAKILDSSLVNPKDFALNSLQAIASGAELPVSELIGNQTGRLAGDQDRRGFLSQVQARRQDWGTDMITNVLDWMIEYGVLPEASYGVEWPDVQAPSMSEKLDNAAKMADVNMKVFQSGGMPPFSGEEIREGAGYDPDDMEDDEDMGDEPTEDEVEDDET